MTSSTIADQGALMERLYGLLGGAHGVQRKLKEEYVDVLVQESIVRLVPTLHPLAKVAGDIYNALEHWTHREDGERLPRYWEELVKKATILIGYIAQRFLSEQKAINNIHKYQSLFNQMERHLLQILSKTTALGEHEYAGRSHANFVVWDGALEGIFPQLKFSRTDIIRAALCRCISIAEREAPTSKKTSCSDPLAAAHGMPKTKPLQLTDDESSDDVHSKPVSSSSRRRNTNLKHASGTHEEFSQSSRLAVDYTQIRGASPSSFDDSDIDDANHDQVPSRGSAKGKAPSRMTSEVKASNNHRGSTSERRSSIATSKSNDKRPSISRRQNSDMAGPSRQKRNTKIYEEPNEMDEQDYSSESSGQDADSSMFATGHKAGGYSSLPPPRASSPNKYQFRPQHAQSFPLPSQAFYPGLVISDSFNEYGVTRNIFNRTEIVIEQDENDRRSKKTRRHK
ncbi:hypothetical protein CVT24_005198 [Panaeolus cyanescens]|uniref:Uncharacterized protein n=1 Tax=Panaeolus cyanescens TaxID=181874 RepID=A0A409Y984_9AGAR|nr:hypothetical protein CVT24_005198 [Panaeolus cyanescens]